MEFAVPSTVPQDLQLIQDIVGALPEPKTTGSGSLNKATQAEESIESSGSEDEGEKPVAAEPKPDAPDDSTSASDSDSDSDTSSEDDEPQARAPKPEANDEDDADEEGGPIPGSGSYLTTKNEVAEADILIPCISAVGPEERLEKVGHVMNVLEDVAIVRGIPGGPFSGVDRALDADTLLVFEDRTVFGHVYETFGPTAMPMYQVKFNSKYPLDPGRVRADREVYHVPERSRFISISQIRAFKGSDASNMHDEEPGDDEIEFSDDEAEAAYKAAKKKKRRASSRDSSVGPSRHGTPSSRMGTPAPSMIRDQDLANDMTWGEPLYMDPYEDPRASTSRAASLSYDDAYADYNPDAEEARQPPSSSVATSASRSEADALRPAYMPRRGRGRGRGGIGTSHPSRGSWSGPSQQGAYNPQDSLQGGHSNAAAFPPGFSQSPYGSGWSQGMQPQPQMHPQALQGHAMFGSPLVQPHINPMFFAGMSAGMPQQPFPQQNNAYTYNAPGAPFHGGFSQGQAYGAFGQPQPHQQPQQAHSQQNWSDQWSVPMNGAQQQQSRGGQP